jgi:hypothetical protein
MAIVGYQLMKKMAVNLVDEVFDLGDALLVRSGGREERIALADIQPNKQRHAHSPEMLCFKIMTPGRIKNVFLVTSCHTVFELAWKMI